MKKKHTYTIKKLSDDNIEDLVELYKASFGKTTSKEFLQKKFNTKFSGFKNVGFIAYSNEGEASAFYGVLPCFCVINDKKSLVAQSGHTMTHPKHRRAKLFTTLAEKTFDYCKKNGFKAIFGFPNIYSYASFIKKLNWIHFDDYHSFLPKTGSFPWIRLKRLIPSMIYFHNKIQLRTLEKFENTNGFENSIKSNHPQIVHDPDFHEFKKFQNSYLKNIGTYKIWFKLTEMSLMVGDINESENLSYAHKEICKLARKLGIPHVRYQVSSGTKLYYFCKKQSFQKGNTYPIAGIALEEGFPINKMKFTLADFDTF